MNRLVEEEMRGWTPTGYFFTEWTNKSWYEFWRPKTRTLEVYIKDGERRVYDPDNGYGHSITIKEFWTCSRK